MPRKAEYALIKKRMENDPVFAGNWKEIKRVESQRQRDAKLTPEELELRKFRREHPAEYAKQLDRIHARRKRMKHKKRGWTPEALEFAKNTQNGHCAICNEITELVPDHEHCVPPKPRQLLCKLCNSMLGFAKDDPKLLEIAASYLRKWGKT